MGIAAVPSGTTVSPRFSRQRLRILAILGTLFWVCSFAYVVPIDPIVRLANILGPVTIFATLGLSALAAVRSCPEIVWTPYAWFLAMAALFYGMGPLVHVFGNAQTIGYLNATFILSPHALLFTNILDTVGIFCVLLGFHITERYIPLNFRNSGVSSSPAFVIRPERVAVAFLLFGGLFEYGVILPYVISQTQFIIPGVLFNIRQLYLMGLMVASFLAVYQNRWRIIFWLLWIPQLTVAMLEFSKKQLLLTLVLPVIGAFLAHKRIRRLILWGMLALLVYIFVQPMVLWGRHQIYVQNGNINQATLSQRMHLVENYFSQGRLPSTANPKVNFAWIRLDYAPEQAFAVAQYNAGNPSHSLKTAAYVWIPRIIWPSKPVTTNLGIEFYRLLTGREGTNLGLGAFGEGYWNFGWIGVLGLSLIAGVVFAILSRRAIQWINRREFAYLPCVLLGINMGAVGLTDFFANGIVGPLAIFYVYWLLVYLITLLYSAARPK